MENAVDALKMAFAIFMFILALTILFMAVTRTKIAADNLYYYADKTNFYQHAKSKTSNRIVKAPDIVSTIYKYDTELIAVKVMFKDGSEYIFDLDEKDAAEKQTMKDNLSECVGRLGNKIFTEEFVEVPVTGIYIPTVDGTEITLAKGEKKVYITYNQTQNN